MISFKNDVIGLNAKMAVTPTKRFIVVRRHIEYDSNEVQMFELYNDAASLDDAREVLSQAIEAFRMEFNLVLNGDTKHMLAQDNCFNFPVKDGTCVIKIYDAFDFDVEPSDSYVWQFDEQGIPVSCSANGEMRGKQDEEEDIDSWH